MLNHEVRCRSINVKASAKQCAAQLSWFQVMAHHLTHCAKLSSCQSGPAII